MNKHLASGFLAAMSVISGIAGNVYKCDHWKAAVFFWVMCGILFVLTLIVGYIESIPKPHLVPIGYGKEDGRVDGLVYFNDGECAYAVAPPPPTPLGGTGAAQLILEDQHITRLSTLGGKQIFPITVRDSMGDKINDLRGEMVIRDVDSVLVSFRCADAKKPTILRYTTTCKIEPTTKGIIVKLEKHTFAWWKLF